MRTSEQIADLAAALAKAQAKIMGAAKDSANPFFRSKYADLASVWNACRDALTENGLSVSQWLSADGATVTCETLLAHASGQWISGALTMTAKDDTPQSIGSCATYLRRYSLAAATSVAPEDDDGEAAQPRGGDPPERRGFRPRQEDAPPPAQEPPADNGESAATREAVIASIRKAESLDRIIEGLPKISNSKKLIRPDKIKCTITAYEHAITFVAATPSLKPQFEAAITNDKLLAEPQKQLIRTQLQGALQMAAEDESRDAFGGDA